MARPQSRLGVGNGAQSYGLFPMNINGTMLMSEAMPKGNDPYKVRPHAHNSHRSLCSRGLVFLKRRCNYSASRTRSRRPTRGGSRRA